MGEFLTLDNVFTGDMFSNECIVMLWLNGNRTLCRPVLPVIILVIKNWTPAAQSSNFLTTHSHDYRLHRTPLDPFTRINHKETQRLYIQSSNQVGEASLNIQCLPCRQCAQLWVGLH